MAFDSSDNRALYNDIHATCLPVKEDRKERKPTAGICSPHLKEQPLQKIRQHFTHQRIQPDRLPLRTTIYRPQCHLQPKLHWHLQSLSSPGVAQHCLHPSRGAWSLPATPDSWTRSVSPTIKNYSILILVTLKGRGLPELSNVNAGYSNHKSLARQVCHILTITFKTHLCDRHCKCHAGSNPHPALLRPFSSIPGQRTVTLADVRRQMTL